MQSFSEILLKLVPHQHLGRGMPEIKFKLGFELLSNDCVGHNHSFKLFLSGHHTHGEKQGYVKLSLHCFNKVVIYPRKICLLNLYKIMT